MYHPLYRTARCYVQTLASLWRFKQTLLFRSGFQPVDTPWSAGTGPVLQCWFFLTLLHWWIYMILLAFPMLSNPLSLAHTHTHTHLKFIKTESPRKLRHRPPFLCTEPNRSKHCLLLLINSVSFQQESMLFLCHRLTHTLAHIDSQKCSSFQLMISGRIHCSGKLWSGLPASRKQGKVWQSFSWKNPLRDQHEAWFQSPREKLSEHWPGWLGMLPVTSPAKLVTGCPDVIARH